MSFKSSTWSALDVFVEPQAFMGSVIGDSRRAFAGAMTVIYLLTAVGGTFLVLSDDTCVDAYLKESVDNRPAHLSIERAQSASERARLALRSPGVKLLLSLHAGVSKIVVLVAMWAVIGTTGALVDWDRGVFGKAVLVCGAATPIVALGALTQSLLRLAFEDMHAVAGLAAWRAIYSGNSLACSFLTAVDVFSLWYLIVVMRGLVFANGWKSLKAAGIVLSSWVLVLFFSFLAEIGASWTL